MFRKVDEFNHALKLVTFYSKKPRQTFWNLRWHTCRSKSAQASRLCEPWYIAGTGADTNWSARWKPWFGCDERHLLNGWTIDFLVISRMPRKVGVFYHAFSHVFFKQATANFLSLRQPNCRSKVLKHDVYPSHMMLLASCWHCQTEVPQGNS